MGREIRFASEFYRSIESPNKLFHLIKMSRQAFKRFLPLALKLVTQTHLLLPNFNIIIFTTTTTTTTTIIIIIKYTTATITKSTISFFSSLSTSASKILKHHNNLHLNQFYILINNRQQQQEQKNKNQFLKPYTRCQDLKLSCVTTLSN